MSPKIKIGEIRMEENKNIQAEAIGEEQLKNVVGGRAAIIECPKCKQNSYWVSTTSRQCSACGYNPALKECPQCKKIAYKVQYNVGNCSECHYQKVYSGSQPTPGTPDPGSSPTPIDSASPVMPGMP